MIDAGGEETLGDSQIDTRRAVDIHHDEDGQSKKENCCGGADPHETYDDGAAGQWALEECRRSRYGAGDYQEPPPPPPPPPPAPPPLKPELDDRLGGVVAVRIPRPKSDTRWDQIYAFSAKNP